MEDAVTRLEQFAAALEANDLTTMPQTYMQNDDPMPFVNDVREVLASLRHFQTVPPRA